MTQGPASPNKAALAPDAPEPAMRRLIRLIAAQVVRAVRDAATQGENDSREPEPHEDF